MPYPGPQPRPAIPPPPTQGNGFGAGLSQFIEAYRNERQSKKQEAAANFDRHMALLQQGLPGVDLKKMAKWAKEAGLEFDYDSSYSTQPPAPPQQQGGPMPPQAAPQMGPPQQAAPPPPPQQRPGFFNKLGAAMGVPQPPSAAQQRGAMQMLGEMQKRGQMSAEMKQTALKMQQQAMQIMGEVESMIAGGSTMEDPKLMTKIMQLRALAGNLPDGGPYGQAMAKMFAPKTMAAGDEAMAAEKRAEQESKLREKVVDWGLKNNLDLGQVTAVARGELDPSELDASSIGSEREAELMRDVLPDVMALYPDAPPDVLAQFSSLLVKGADNSLITALKPKLGTTMAEKRFKQSQESSKRSDRSLAVAEAGLKMRQDALAEDSRIQALLDEAIKEHGKEKAIDYLKDYAEKPGDIARMMQSFRLPLNIRNIEVTLEE